LEGKILPDIIKRYDEKVDIWSAGCALGQEVYSIAIVLDRIKGKFERLPRLSIYATDSNPEYLKKAVEGVYSLKSLKGLSEQIKRNYFHRKRDESDYCVVDSLKRDIQWEVHDMITQPPLLGRFQIIFLRNNLLTYYRAERIERVFLKIVDSLDEGGFLIVGRHEKIPVQTTLLMPYKGCSYIFQKTDATRKRPC
jgi:chemotaxis protein methyltransferase CheR